MKKQTNVKIGAHFIRGASYLLVVVAGTVMAFFGPESPPKVLPGTLSFAERVAYQRAIEEVYWRHRIWPKENPNPKPSLDAVMSRAQLEKKVADYLSNSKASEGYWQRPITPEELQAEMDRMAQYTKEPEVLGELFDALGNDPFVIAECLARPILSERLKHATVESRKGSLESSRAGPENQMLEVTTPEGANYTLPVLASPSGSWSPSRACTEDTWTSTSTTNAPDARSDHTTVWTGSEMIVWGGFGSSGELNTGGRYDPSTDSWTATTITNAPTGRDSHTAVWTGSEMVIWGGNHQAAALNTGGRYNPSTDTWIATSTTNAPDARVDHTAVWTGSEMIVWGGFFGIIFYNTGGKYNPITDTWVATSTTDAPSGRARQTAVWTGSEMIVWSGFCGCNTGGKYNPNTDTWVAISTTNAPDARWYHSSVWTGKELIIWGGTPDPFNVVFNTGGRYNPSTDSWVATSTASAPDARYRHTAVWTGEKMIVWGGQDANSGVFNTGGSYDPVTDSWIATGVTNAPDARTDHAAVCTGSELIVWGGDNGSPGSYLNNGGRYCAAPSATPTVTPTATASPTPTLTPRPTPTPRRPPTPARRPTP